MDTVIGTRLFKACFQVLITGKNIIFFHRLTFCNSPRLRHLQQLSSFFDNSPDEVRNCLRGGTMGTKSLKICRRQAIFFPNMEHFSSRSQNKVAQIRCKMGAFYHCDGVIVNFYCQNTVSPDGAQKSYFTNGFKSKGKPLIEILSDKKCSLSQTKAILTDKK